MKSMKMKSIRSTIINTLFLSGFFIVLAASFYRYYFLKEFPVYIEVTCDPAAELCFHRDCEVDECPPNDYADYRQFTLPGSVLVTCDDIDGCAEVCKSQAGVCEETVCGDDPEDVCSEPPQTVEE